MKAGRVNVLLDAQWGSSGKGKFAAWMAEYFGITMATASNMPNAGHTVVFGDKKLVFKVLPSAATGGEIQAIMLSPSTVFDVEQLGRELSWIGSRTPVYIHGRAMVLTADHVATEREQGSLRRIASTMQGCATAMVEKIMRAPDAIVQNSWDGTPSHGHSHVIRPDEWRDRVRDHLAEHGMLLHEVSQGFALSIDHGSHYPHCTSRNCTTARALDDLGVSPRLLGDVYLNVRPFPIRVGHFIDSDTKVGDSGGVYEDCWETDWEDVGTRAGMPRSEIDALYSRELTTVTKRLRRVFSFSEEGFAEACHTNGPTGIFLNFAQYLDWEIAGGSGACSISSLPTRVRDFVLMLERISRAPVRAIGTGADHNHVLTIQR